MREKCKVYIAGPITGVPAYKKNFKEAEKKLEAMGLEPVNPVAPGLVEGAAYKYYIDRGLAFLIDCDMICLIPGWSQSTGARLEKQYADTVGLPTMFLTPYSQKEQEGGAE